MLSETSTNFEEALFSPEDFQRGGEGSYRLICTLYGQQMCYFAKQFLGAGPDSDMASSAAIIQVFSGNKDTLLTLRDVKRALYTETVNQCRDMFKGSVFYNATEEEKLFAPSAIERAVIKTEVLRQLSHDPKHAGIIKPN
jgi:hypothetical protein